MRAFARFALSVFAALLPFASTIWSQDLSVYDDALQNSFADWSWAAHDLANPSPVYSGSASVSFEPDGWTGIYFHRSQPLQGSNFESLKFWIHGGDGGDQGLQLSLQIGETGLGSVDPTNYLASGSIPAGSWVEVVVPIADLGANLAIFDGIILMDGSGADQATVFVDDMVLTESTIPPPPAEEVEVSVDPSAERRAIDPLIYGVNFNDPQHNPGQPLYPVHRWGGNSVTRYNWQVDVSNRASDWFFLNIPGDADDPSQLPNGSEADQFIDGVLSAGVDVLLTVPTIGWTPSPIREKRWSFSEAKYGPQLQTEGDWGGEADAGDGQCDPAVNTTGYCIDGQIVGNDPSDASMEINATFVNSWMAHIASRVGSAEEGGVRFFALDNEPMLWNSTHRDVHPNPATFDEVWLEGLDIATAIKAADSQALVLGPVVWGWCAYYSSAFDAAYANGSCIDGPDRQAHGGMAFLPWYLDQICSVEQSTGVRPVDYLDIHYYPQGGEFSGSEDPATAALRLRSVKELYDPTYVSESWIPDAVALVPTMRSWIDGHCPGVKLAITEYSWGSDDGASSALAQAEILAIFGREGVDLATRWVGPSPGSRVEDAFKLYLDYDGAGAGVSGDSVQAISADVDAVGAYAIRSDDDRLFVLLFNKETAPRTAVVTVASPPQGEGLLYGFDGVSGLSSLGTAVPSGNTYSVGLGARSANLLVLQLSGSLLFRDGFETGNSSAWNQ